MPLTITLTRAAAHLGDQRLAALEPAALLVDQPLSSQQPADPVAYGQRLFAALGGDALRSALATLPAAPHLPTTEKTLARCPTQRAGNEGCRRAFNELCG